MIHHASPLASLPQTDKDSRALAGAWNTSTHPVNGYGAVNWRGLWTLTLKEIHRFLKIPTQTLIAPVVTILLFYAVFKFTLDGMSTGDAGATGPRIGAVPLMAYILPGLVMMGLAQNAFFNTSSALILSKIQGNIVDLLLAPLSPFETVLAYVVSGVVRGFCVGGLAIAALAFVEPMTFVDVGFVIYHGVMGAMFLSLLGLLTGIWADKFDQLVAVQNILILPATFLSGTFFSVAALPSLYRQISALNPFYYMIDGFRYGFTGQAETMLSVGLLVMLGLNAVLFVAAQMMIAHGKTLRN